MTTQRYEGDQPGSVHICYEIRQLVSWEWYTPLKSLFILMRDWIKVQVLRAKGPILSWSSPRLP